MSNIQWSQEQIMLFLETLQAETIIWDTNDKCHKDKKKVNDAWVRIRDIFEGNVTVEELKKKKDSLFATYRGYCRKVQASLKSGAGVDDVYRPVWFAFELMDSFLGTVFKCKQTMPTDQETGSIIEERQTEDAVATGPTEDSVATGSQSRRTVRRRDNPPELQVASRQMTEAFNTLNKIITTKPARDVAETEDECDVFGRLIAKKLKKLPEYKREDLMFEIHALFQRSRVDISPTFESFRSSTPKSTISHPSFTCNKRPKTANTDYHYNAEDFSPRPHSSNSEPPNTYITFSNRPNERQSIYYMQRPTETTSDQHPSKIHVISDEVIVPETQIQPVRLQKHSESENSVVMFHIPETETQDVATDDSTPKNDLLYQAYYKS